MLLEEPDERLSLLLPELLSGEELLTLTLLLLLLLELLETLLLLSEGVIAGRLLDELLSELSEERVTEPLETLLLLSEGVMVGRL